MLLTSGTLPQLRFISTTSCSTKCLAEKFKSYGNSVIRATIEKGSPIKAIAHYSSLLLLPDFRPDRRTFELILKSCRISRDGSVLKQTHATIVKFGFHSSHGLANHLFRMYLLHNHLIEARHLFDVMPKKDADPTCGNLMIMGLVRNGDVDGANQIFKEMPVKDLVSWNSLISSCSSSRPNQAISFFKKMLTSGVDPDGFSCSSVLSACARVGALNLGMRVHQFMVDRKIKFNHILSSAVIDMYAKCGRIDLAIEVFDTVERDNVSVWNSMITGFAIHGLSTQLSNFLINMEDEGVGPDGVTFVGVLTACSHCGMIQEGRYYFHAMKDLYKIEPRIEHFGAMVDMLSRAGYLEEAYETINRMSMKPDSIVWRALLSGCKKYKRPDLAEIAIEKISNRESGDYVLLSNVYCSTKQWDFAENMWSKMKKEKIRKERGLSWVEIGSKLYKFKAGDQSHAETENIYMVLENLMRRVKENGYR